MTARRAARAPRPGAHALADVAVLVAALAVAALPVVPAYAVGAVWPALLGGLAVGAAIAATAARRGWAVLPTLAVLVVAFVVAGGALAAPGTTLGGVVPTGATVRTLLGGVVTVWADVLTRQAPLGADGGTLVAPYTLAVAGAAAAVSVALRARTASRAVLAAAAPPLVGVAALALGTRETLLPMVTGLVAAGGLLTWVAWRLGRLAVRRVVALALTVAVAGAGGVVVGPVLADQRPRYVLRDEVTPPFDPREQPSPLAGYRRFVKDWQDTPLLTVRGLPDGAPVRLATLDAYDGVVWSVGAPGAASGSGAFRRPAGSVDAGAAGAPAPDGRAATVDVEVHALPGVWLPTVGEAAAVRVTGSSAGTSADTSADTSAQADPADGLRVNRTTDTAVLTGGVPDGLTYTLDTTVPPVPDDAAIGAAAPAAVTLPPVTAVPDVVGLVAGEMAGQASTPLEVARALEAGLAERGWFSHGNTDAGDHPSLSGHGADRITSLLSGDLMVGDSEQYASAMALMARELGLPARVVLGFRPDAGAPADGDAGEVVVTGDDAQAWVEIAFAGHGWVPFHPTPDESRTPDERTPQDEAQPEPQVVQPPPPPAEPVAPPEVDAEQPITEDPSGPDAATAGWPRVVAVAAAVVGVPLLLVLAPLAGLAVLRMRRRRRRRTAPDAVTRVVGGWEEVLDAAADLALPVTVGATRREAAACLAVGVGAASAAPLTGLATRADAVVFAPGHPGDAEVDGYWAGVDDVVAAMRAAVPRSRRLRSRWSTASLRRRRGARAPVPVPPRDRTVEQGARPAVPAPVTGPSPRTVPSRTSTPHAVSARTAPPHPVRTHPRPIRPGRTGRHTVPTAPTPRPRGRSSRDGES